MCIWLDKCLVCNGTRDNRTMLYRSTKTNAAAEYRRLETEINQSGIVKLQSRPLGNKRVCLPCLWSFVLWLRAQKNASPKIPCES
jgi:hypothetical protein